MCHLLLLLPLLSACGPKKVDRFVTERVLDRGAEVHDVDMVCSLGAALSHPLAALAPEDDPPLRALVVADAAAGLCWEPEAREAELEAVRAGRNLAGVPGVTAEIRDARERERRAHAEAARRFHRAWLRMEPAFGPVGEGSCPRLRSPGEELAYALGLFAGVVGLLHDRRAGGEVGVPAEVLGRVSRGATCLDDEDWWSLPSALGAAAGAVIPGAGEVPDPWAVLEEAATRGEDSGVRLARALQVMLAANAGRSSDVARGIRAHARALERTPPHPEWALLDAYATELTRHESDLIWTRARGYRSGVLGELPGEPEESTPIDLFGDDDPFAQEPQ